MQAALSPGVYLAILHRGALTSKLPLFDDDGRPTGEFQSIDADTRIDLAKFLINKIVPDAPRTEIRTEIPIESLQDSDFRSLPTAELLRLANFAPAHAESASDPTTSP